MKVRAMPSDDRTDPRPDMPHRGPNRRTTQLPAPQAPSALNPAARQPVRHRLPAPAGRVDGRHDRVTSAPTPTSVARPLRPMLRPGTELLWLSTGELGVGSRPGVRLHADAATLIGVARSLAGVDGTRPWDEVATDPLSAELLDVLVQAGCIIDDQGRGTGPVSGLASSRLRVIDADHDDAFELARGRAQARVAVAAPDHLARPIISALLDSGVECVDDGAPTVAAVVQVHEGGEPRLDPTGCDRWLRGSIPHLAASICGTRVRITHIVRPGVTACVRCLAIADDDRDLTTFATRPGSGTFPTSGHGGTALGPDVVALCTGLVVGRLLAFIDGVHARSQCPMTLDTCGRTALHSADVHPRCGCAITADLRL